MRSIKIVSFLLASLFSSVVFADTSDNARDTLPACDKAEIMIFNGTSFDGTVYLHETDVKVSADIVRTVRALAKQGHMPALCEDAGTVMVSHYTMD